VIALGPGCASNTLLLGPSYGIYARVAIVCLNISICSTVITNKLFDKACNVLVVSVTQLISLTANMNSRLW